MPARENQPRPLSLTYLTHKSKNIVKRSPHLLQQSNFPVSFSDPLTTSQQQARSKYVSAIKYLNFTNPLPNHRYVIRGATHFHVAVLPKVSPILIDWSPSTFSVPPPNRSSPLLQADLVNSRSVRNKTPLIISLMSDISLDALFITETWLSPIDTPRIAELNYPPYMFIHHPRDSINPGGGIGIMYKSTLVITNVTKHKFTHSEAISCAISSKFARTFKVPVLQTTNTISSFLDELALLLPNISLNTILLEDFNWLCFHRSPNQLQSNVTCNLPHSRSW